MLLALGLPILELFFIHFIISVFFSNILESNFSGEATKLTSSKHITIKCSIHQNNKR